MVNFLIPKMSLKSPIFWTYLLVCEDVLIDVMLQFLISVVDAQLLKTVRLEVLEPKHVQDTNGQTLKPKHGSFKKE